MVGKPEKIAYSLLIKILEIADRQRRDCFLIAFSVSINPIDVRRERARLLEFFSTTLVEIRMLPECCKLSSGCFSQKGVYECGCVMDQ